MELEAYIGEDDRASHARFGRTARNAVMYGHPGIAYVYLVYGMYDCLNIVTEEVGRPAALLVRAVEPIEGVELMRAARIFRETSRRRRRSSALTVAAESRIAALPAERLASGPGLVSTAFGLDRSATGLDLLDPASPVRIEVPPAGETPGHVTVTPRLGIDFADRPWTEVPWRFVLAGHPAVSGGRATRVG